MTISVLTSIALIMLGQPLPIQKLEHNLLEPPAQMITIDTYVPDMVGSTCGFTDDNHFWYAHSTPHGHVTYLYYIATGTSKRAGSEVERFPMTETAHSVHVTRPLALAGNTLILSCPADADMFPGDDPGGRMLVLWSEITPDVTPPRHADLLTHNEQPGATLRVWIARRNGSDLRYIGSLHSSAATDLNFPRLCVGGTFMCLQLHNKCYFKQVGQFSDRFISKRRAAQAGSNILR